MSPLQLIILFSVLGLFLLIAEVALPTHGILGVVGVAFFLAAIGYCFVIDRWLGLCVLAAGVAAAPFVGAAFVKLWPRTLIGRRIILQKVEIDRPPLAAQIGQTGTTISELRPMGVCEFAGQRMEALSELGMVSPGCAVRVVGIDGRRPIVRPIDEQQIIA